MTELTGADLVNVIVVLIVIGLYIAYTFFKEKSEEKKIKAKLIRSKHAMCPEFPDWIGIDEHGDLVTSADWTMINVHRKELGPHNRSLGIHALFQLPNGQLNLLYFHNDGTDDHSILILTSNAGRATFLRAVYHKMGEEGYNIAKGHMTP